MWLGPYNPTDVSLPAPSALIAATSVNTNVSSSSLTAPHGPSQVCVYEILSMSIIHVVYAYVHNTALNFACPPAACTQSSLLMSALLHAGLEPSQIAGLQMHANGKSTPCSQR